MRRSAITPIVSARGSALGAFLCAALGVGVCLAVAAPAAGQPGAPQAAVARADFREVVQDAKSKVFPAVVYIKCVRESNEQGKKESQQIAGSGVIISRYWYTFNL